MDTSSYITVMQVFKLMDIVPDRYLSWAVGARVARLYTDSHGIQPPKANRPKTSGGGSHCFALYPPDWQPIITQIIKSETLLKSKQASLFNDEETP